MKRVTLLSLVLVAALLSAIPASAQTQIQQSATDLRACTPSNATAAVNNAVTLTITPPAGQYVYLCGLDIAISQDGTSTANTNVQFTSTNLGGWAWKYSLPATANLSLTQPFYFTTPVKSAAAGVAVTIVSPTAKANSAFSTTGYYYFAP